MSKDLVFCLVQECAPGYYRDTVGLFLGKCVPCSCNGHSDRCLDGSGVCVVRTTSEIFPLFDRIPAFQPPQQSAGFWGAKCAIC